MTLITVHTVIITTKTRLLSGAIVENYIQLSKCMRLVIDCDLMKLINFLASSFPNFHASFSGYEAGRNNLLNDNSERYCSPGQEYAIIIHGWKESCDTEWVSLLASSEWLILLLLPVGVTNYFPPPPSTT